MIVSMDYVDLYVLLYRASIAGLHGNLVKGCGLPASATSGPMSEMPLIVEHYQPYSASEDIL